MSEDTLATEEASVVDTFINYDGSMQGAQSFPREDALKENMPTVAEPKALSTKLPITIIDSYGTNADDEKLYNLAAALVSFSAQSIESPKSTPPSEVFNDISNDDSPIQAYAKIEGEGWVYFMKKPSCVFGKAPSKDMQFKPGNGKDPVDFYLSNDELISPLHLRIEYSPDRLCWEALCVGKSSIGIDGVNVEPFSPPHSLKLRSTVQVSSIEFVFMQPGPHELNSSDSSRSSTPLSDECTVAGFPGSDKPWKIYDPLKATRSKSRKIKPSNTAADGQLGEELVKPSQSYACLIAEAINSVPEKRMTLSGIYQFLADHYPYFRQTKNGWQNSVRHNLSLNKAFKKVPREAGEQGKGMFWVVDSDFEYLVKGSSGRRSISRSRSATPAPLMNTFSEAQTPIESSKTHSLLSLKNPYFPTSSYARPLSASPTSFANSESISGISALSSASLLLSLPSNDEGSGEYRQELHKI